MSNRFSVMFGRAVAQGFITALCLPVMAQIPSLSTSSQAARNISPNSVVTLPQASLKDFDTVLPQIAQQGHVALVCESQPLHLTLTNTQAADLAHRLGSAGIPLEETVKEVAAAYDYDAQRLSADTFLLTKRYTDKNDLPDVTFEETVASLQNILDATQNYRFPLGPEKTLLNIISSESQEEKAQLAQGVPVSQLSVGQQQMAWQFACGNALHSLTNLERVSQRLKACKEDDTFLCYRQLLNLTYTAYQGPFAPTGATSFFALSSWVDTTSGGGTTLDESSGVHGVDDKIIVEPGAKDPTDPDGPVLPTAPSSLCLTLAALAKQLISRPSVGGVSATPVLVEAALAHKVLCLTGGKFASPDSLIQAVCAMYGLERHDGYTINAVTIATPRPKVLSDASAIKAEVTRLLPAAFLRAVQARGTQNTFMQTAGSDYSTVRGDSLFIASVRRLRGIVEPLLDRIPQHQLSVPNASDEARGLIGLSSLAKCIQDVQALTVPCPLFIEDFDSATFTVTQNAGDPNTFAYGVVYRSPRGQFSQISGEMGYPQGTFGYGTRTGPGVSLRLRSVGTGPVVTTH